MGNLSYTTVFDPWKAHYSRIIENQLDAVHLPFVHYNTMGRGCKTLVDGPKVEWVNDNKFFMYVQNRSDDGTKPLKPEEMKGNKYSSSSSSIRICGKNFIADKMRIVAAFVPVDENNSILTLHVFQGFVTIPGIKQIVDSINRSFSLKVAHQDRRVVETQVPKSSGLKIGENLFQGDHPIMEYRRRRAELMKLAGMEPV